MRDPRSHAGTVPGAQGEVLAKVLARVPPQVTGILAKTASTGAEMLNELASRPSWYSMYIEWYM